MFPFVFIIQKTIEVGQLNSIRSLLTATQSLSVNSIYGLIRFDPFGRLVSRNYVVQQILPNKTQITVAPLSIGTPIILPIPTWNERVFISSLYKTRKR